ncbi:uncharacterized protein F4817DRAFT_344866 [Daldinia loculata]|uniref:uncharacterized protein n=1 Tax=Daldinia loculata TaxID=103429 RepID=UPI0020C55079|nr:uncharacterized protein F4817DRAFT_344866 [Daldinia loculata]KAI1645075.1 hypothetical protein F4817DRAFT_344866 [Daldinia loculata]
MPPTRTNNKVQMLTPRDTEIIDTILQACPPHAKPKIDWTTVAHKLGLKNEPSAKETFRILCKKRNWFTATDSQSKSESKSSLSPKKEAATQDERPFNINKYNTRGRARKEPQAKLRPSTTEFMETTESEEETISDDVSDFDSDYGDV